MVFYQKIFFSQEEILSSSRFPTKELSLARGSMSDESIALFLRHMVQLFLSQLCIITVSMLLLQSQVLLQVMHCSLYLAPVSSYY